VDALELYAAPLVKSALAAFRNFAGIEAVPVSPCFAAPPPVPGGVTAVIRISGAVNGAVSLVMSRDFALEVTGRILGLAPSRSSAAAGDAAGEMLNIIAGNIKHHMDDERRIELSLPRVYGAYPPPFYRGEGRRPLCVSFRQGGHRFFLVLQIEDASNTGGIAAVRR